MHTNEASRWVQSDTLVLGEAVTVGGGQAGRFPWAHDPSRTGFEAARVRTFATVNLLVFASRGGVAFAPDRERWEGRWGAASSLAGVPDRPASAAHYISATADVTPAFLLWTPAFYCGREVRLPCALLSPATCAPLRLFGCVCTRLRAFTAACLICAPWGVSMCCRLLLSRIIMPCTSPPSLPL